MNFPLNLIIGTHNHVPYGLGNEEFELIYKNKLRPFIVALNNFPAIQASLHYSGVLLNWIEKAHPEFFMLISDLITRKQVEILGGGFYDPLLPLLPLSDKIGQIEMLTTYIRKQFGKRPQGCWLPALAWEQNLAGVLNTCGMSYTFLREEQFVQAGLSGDALRCPCYTEDQGRLLTIFPITTGLRADINRKGVDTVLEGIAARAAQNGAPHSGAEQVIGLFPEYLFSGADSPRRGFDYSGFDGEINRFFETLSRCTGFAEFTTPVRYNKTRQGLNKAYFRGSNEGENPVEHPRQFLITYPEANGIYAKMMFTNVLINQLRGDKSRKRTAREELWKAQGCDSFYHTESGGIYRRQVRSAAYQALLEAEKITREKGVFIPSLMTFDFDLDGEQEYLFQGERINCYVKAAGAGIFEFDFLPKSWNYLDTLSDPAFSGGSPRQRRSSFADILAPPDLDLSGLDLPVLAPAEKSSHIGIRRCEYERYVPEDLNKTREKALFRLPSVSVDTNTPEGVPDSKPYGDLEIEKAYQL
jgi:hypothetical protein